MTSPPDEIEVVELDDAGFGVGQLGALRVHVADLLPGERARIHLEHRSPHRPEAWGKRVELLGPPSPDRVAPRCPAFGRCGGCVWQHLAYEAQLRAKRERVVRALEEALGAPPAVEPAVAAPAETGYRNKGKYVIGQHWGRLVLGAFAPRTHRLVDTLGCAVVEPAIDAAARALRQALEPSALSVYDEANRTGCLRYAIIRSGADGQLLISLVTTAATERAPLQAIAEALVADGHATGVAWVRNDSPSGALLTEDVEPLAGETAVRERFGDVAVEVGAGEFLQVNRVQAQRLYERVAALAGAAPEMRVVDVYCGLGGISFALAAAGARVVGLESHAGAVARANEAAERAGLGDRVSFRVADAAVLGAVAAEIGATCVVVNPPRKGLHAAALAALIDAAPVRLVYVSCGPESLGRDLCQLVRAGYAVEAVEPWDLMPGTPQVETVCLLTR